MCIDGLSRFRSAGDVADAYAECKLQSITRDSRLSAAHRDRDNPEPGIIWVFKRQSSAAVVIVRKDRQKWLGWMMFVGSNSTSVASRRGLAGRRREAGLRSPRPVPQNRCCSATGPVGRRSPDPRYRLTLPHTLFAKLQSKAADADGRLALQSASTSPPALHWLLDLHGRAKLRCQHLNDFLGHEGKQGSDDHRNNNVDEWIARDLHRENVFTGLEQSQCCNRRIAVNGCRTTASKEIFAPR